MALPPKKRPPFLLWHLNLFAIHRTALSAFHHQVQKAQTSWGSAPKWWGKGEHKDFATGALLAGQVWKTVPFWAIVSFCPPKIYGTSYVNVPFLEALWWKTLQQKIPESLAGDLSAVSYMAQRHTGLTQARNCVSCRPLASWERQGWNLEAKCQFNFPTRAYFSLKKARAENHWDQGCALGAQQPVHTLPASFKTGHPVFFFILQY